MPIPIASAVDYLWQFQRLLPRGRIWHRGWGTLQAQDFLTLMPTWARLHQRAGDVVVETFPCTVAAEMLPEWEATLGLPDCEALGTIQQRQAAVCAKFAMRGGQSIDYFIALAAAHGYTIQITQSSAFRVECNSVEDPLNDAAWDFAFIVTAPSQAITYFSADLSHAEEPLEWWSNDELECLIRMYAPAHTIPMFQYHDLFSVWDDGASLWDDGNTNWDQWGAS